MRTLLAAAVLAAAAPADDPKPKPTEPALKAGDPAPPLKVDKWLHGAEVTGFEPGKVYVVEFWATWCGPCIAIMPHLADLAEQYAANGVTVIGFSSTAQDKLDKNQKFVEKRAAKLGYRFAWCDTDETHKNWMGAARQGGIPCSFVVGKDGKLAYIGHPMYLDDVLPKVVAGTWDVAKGQEELDAADKDFDALFEAIGKAGKADKPQDGLKALADFAVKRPALADSPYLLAPKLELLVKAGKATEAKGLAEAAMARAAKRDDPMPLWTVSRAFRADAAKADPTLTAVAVRAAEANRKLAGDRDRATAVELAEAYAAAGDADKAKRTAAAAVELAEAEAKDGKQAQAYLRLAEALRLAGDEAKARAAAGKAVPLIEAEIEGELDWSNRLRLADAHKQAGEPDKARAAAEAAVVAAKKVRAKHKLSLDSGVVRAVTNRAKPFGVVPDWDKE